MHYELEIGIMEVDEDKRKEIAGGAQIDVRYGSRDEADRAALEIKRLAETSLPRALGELSLKVKQLTNEIHYMRRELPDFGKLDDAGKDDE